jgi:hypothetical protein
MRSVSLIMLFLTISCSSFGQLEARDPAPPSSGTEAQFDRDEARWADLEAQRRATDGDYDGAVQAHQQAEQALQEAERQQNLEQSGR